MKPFRNTLIFSLTAFAIVISGTTLFAQKQTTGRLTVDLDQSQVNWSGRNPSGEHTGTIKLSSGEVTVHKGEMTKGSFILDMNSITNSDLQDADMKSKLVGHLKSPDFFDVAKFPTATFVVTRVARLKAAQNATGEIKATHLVEGNLTMKGITQQVKLNATISIMNGKLTAASLPFKVDRTKWGVNYQSKSIFSELKDKFIYDEITLKIDLLAK